MTCAEKLITNYSTQRFASDILIKVDERKIEKKKEEKTKSKNNDYQNGCVQSRALITENSIANHEINPFTPSENISRFAEQTVQLQQKTFKSISIPTCINQLNIMTELWKCSSEAFNTHTDKHEKDVVRFWLAAVSL